MTPRRFITLMALSSLFCLVSCHDGKTEEGGDEDTLQVTDSLEDDSLDAVESEVEQMRLPEGRDEAFSDFLFTFVNNRKFQSERVRYPLVISDGEGEGQTVRNGNEFRRLFQWPSREAYTVLLTDESQMETYQNDLDMSSAEVQLISLPHHTITGYDFLRSEGRWTLDKGHKFTPEGRMGDFLRFYQRFSTDSVFRQESLAPEIQYVTCDPEDEMATIEGKIEPSQWSAFCTSLPHGTITNIHFGQDYDNSSKMVLIQCATSSGLMDIYTFSYEDGHWKLTGFEN